MKKTVMMLLFLGLFIGPDLYSQRRLPPTNIPGPRLGKYYEFKVGTRYPLDASNGLMGGLGLGWNFDDRFFNGFEVNFFASNYNAARVVAEFTNGGNDFVEKEVTLQFATYIISPLLLMYYETPISTTDLLYFRSSAGLGWTFVWNKEENFEEGVRDTRFLHGLSWQASVGLGIKASDHGMVFIDVFYQYAVPRSSKTVREGLPTFSEFNLSGVGIWAGVNFIFPRNQGIRFLGVF